MKKTVQEGEKEFTASVWIISSSTPKKVLLIHHKKMGKWQQPGGHIEQFENPIEAAVREVLEETGLNIDFLLNKIENVDHESSFLPLPEFFMEQTIPAFGDSPQHYHMDINYVVEIAEQSLKINEREAHSIGWFTYRQTQKLDTHSNTKIVLKKLFKS